jgi:hypothetical protein
MLNAVRVFKMRIQLMLFFSAVLVCGCVPEKPKQPATAPVQGTVLLDGLPVDQAKIVFVPAGLRSVDEKIMRLAYGTTDADGNFELAHSDGTKELLAGTYTVLISKMNSDRDRMSLLDESFADLVKVHGPDEIIPPIYNRESTLMFKLNGSSSIVRPKFELTSMATELDQESNPESR